MNDIGISPNISHLQVCCVHLDLVIMNDIGKIQLHIYLLFF